MAENFNTKESIEEAFSALLQQYLNAQNKILTRDEQLQVAQSKKVLERLSGLEQQTITRYHKN
jgi:hypothetical protein